MAGGLTKGARAGAGVPLPASERRSVRNWRSCYRRLRASLRLTG